MLSRCVVREGEQGLGNHASVLVRLAVRRSEASQNKAFEQTRSAHGSGNPALPRPSQLNAVLDGQ